VGTSSGTCVNSTCQPFYLQTNAGALDAPMLVDTTLNTLYATLSQSAVESISTQTGVVTTSPAVSPFGGPNGMALSMDGTFLYMGVYNPNAADAFGGIIAKLSKASLTSAVTLLASSQETETDFEWVGVVSGSAAPLCVQTYSPNGTPYNAQALLCGSSASGAPTLTVDSCSSGTTTSGTYCYACVGGPVLTPTACAVGNPANPANSTGVGAPTSAAADSNGLVWADAANIYSLSASNLAAKPTIVGSISGTETMGLMVVDANNVYWTYTINGFAYANRASRWASNTMTGLPFINDVPSQLAVDSTYLYWADTQNNEIMAVAINTLQSNNAIVIASAVATAYTPASGTLVNAPTAIAVDGTALYWYNSGTKTIAKMVKALQ
jgi:hypothetical protein